MHLFGKSFLIFLVIILCAGFFRFYQLGSNPPGLYIDEASIGYNAKTILQNGVDEWGQPYPVIFKAFGEYKMPVYIYATAFSLKLFGINEFALRLPSALSGLGTVIAFYFLVRILISFSPKQQKQFAPLPLLATFFLGISPWHIQLSRAGFEATVALFFYTSGAFLFFYFLKKQKILLLFACLFFFLLTMYTYNAYRVLTPLTLFIGGLFLWKKQKIQPKQVLYAGIFCIVLLIPFIQFSLTDAGLARFSQTSAFDTVRAHSVFEKITLYPFIYLRNYFSYFGPQFLFIFGDGFGRHQMVNFGVLFRFALPLLLAGIFFAIKNKNTPVVHVLFFFLVISPIAGALAIPSPHAVRSLLLVLPLSLLCAIGTNYLYKNSAKSKLVLLLIFCFGMYEFASYVHISYEHYPYTNKMDWGGEYKLLVERTAFYSKKYSFIAIDAKYMYPYVYYGFYNGTIKPVGLGQEYVKPKEMGNKKVLFIADPKAKLKGKVIENVFVKDNQNNDIFAVFWEL